MMPPDADGLAILSLLGLQGVGPARVAKVLSWAQARGKPVRTLLEEPRQEGVPLGSEQLQELPAVAERAAVWADKLMAVGAALIPISDARYPTVLRRQLGNSAPPVLAAIGNLSILNAGGVGFCGSRAVSDKGLRVTEDCASQLAHAHLNVVSGYAAGVDMAAHKAALAAGGTTVLVLAEGILNFRLKATLKEQWNPERAAVVSEFLPDRAWSVHNAMQRNRTICGLSQAVVLVEARPEGGSIAAGRTALHLGVPLFAAVFEGSPASAEGNRELLKAGARQLLRSRSTGQANVNPILEALNGAAAATRHETASTGAS